MTIWPLFLSLKNVKFYLRVFANIFPLSQLCQGLALLPFKLFNLKFEFLNPDLNFAFSLLRVFPHLFPLLLQLGNIVIAVDYDLLKLFYIQFQYVVLQWMLLIGFLKSILLFFAKLVFEFEFLYLFCGLFNDLKNGLDFPIELSVLFFELLDGLLGHGEFRLGFKVLVSY